MSQKLDDLATVLNEARNLGRLFQSFGAVMAFLEDVEDLNKLQRHAETRRARAVKGQAAAEGELEVVQRELELAKGALKKAHNDATAVIVQAEQQSKELINKAARDADKLVSDAQTNMRVDADEADIRLSKTRIKIAALEEEKEETQAKLSALKAELKAIQERLSV